MLLVPSEIAGRAAVFEQTFEYKDLMILGVLVILEGVMSIDNALVLSLLAKRVRPELRARVLTYGLVGAFVLRLAAIGSAQLLMSWRIFKLRGGGYLIYVTWAYFLKPFQERRRMVAERKKFSELDSAQTAIPLEEDEPQAVAFAGFWRTILVVELTDLAFAVDSILAGIAMVGSPPPNHVGLHPKLWVVVLGGMFGVLIMGFAAMMFISLLERFPRLELSAYLLVLVIGTKLCLEWVFNGPGHEHRLDFHDISHPAFLVFWAVMVLVFLLGFFPSKTLGNRMHPPSCPTLD